jgi:hypothetical protein
MDIAFIIGFSLGGISAILLAGFMQLCLFPYARAALQPADLQSKLDKIERDNPERHQRIMDRSAALKGTAKRLRSNSPLSDGSKE